ncbi:MAG: 16S rRNA processing protein RimM [Rhodobacteraceae bacterium]|nr:MAG: 16S rRNA processing protein RimM [Paracoccaceae bacterium]
MTNPEKDRVCVAAIAGAFGVRGEARVKSFTADPLAFASYAPLETEDGARRFDVRVTRPVPGGFAARLSGVLTREDAEALKGARLYAPRDRLPALPDDEFYHADLIGLAVFDAGGVALGAVRAVQNFGAGDFLEIGGGPKPLLLPFTRAVVPTVDLSAGRIVADPPEEIVAPDFGKDEA